MLRLLLDSTQDAVVLLDPARRVAHLNRAAADLLGDAGQLGAPVEQLAQRLIPDLVDRLGQDVERTLAEGRIWRGTVELLVEPGRTASYSCSVHRDQEGTAIVARDMSETRLREAAEREVSARDVFVARLGHELRTPLNAALGFAQLLELGDLPGEQREDIAHILTAGRHMQALLDEVLDLSRVRGGGIDLDVGPVPVLEVVQGVVDLVEPLADRRLVRRLVDAGESLEEARALVALADRRRLWQVLLNLVGNAVKYGREGGLVRVAVRRGGAETVVIEVSDDGPGIDPAAMHRVFRPFDRLGQERGGVEGTGLGLAMAQALTQAMRGTLAATSVLGSGTTFTLTLPAMSEVPDEPDPAGAEAQLPLVLHVSSEEGARALVGQALRQRLGVEVITVERGELALEAVRARQPRLVLLDADLADATAGEVLARLASDPLSALVPRIVLTGEQDPRVHLRLRAAGAHEVLPLPLDVRALLQAVASRLAR